MTTLSADATSDFENFRTVYNWGCKNIASVKEASSNLDRVDQCEQILAAANLAIGRLNGSPYGRSLINDSDLQSVRMGLEELLERSVARITNRNRGPATDEHRAVIWFKAPFFKAERTFRFWGELGEILHYFRDEAQSIGTDDEKFIREHLLDECIKLAIALDSVLHHPVLKAVYLQDSLNQLRSTRTSLIKTATAVKTPPVLKGSKNPFQKGDPNNDTIIRRQFVISVCHLSFELFGSISTDLVENLLDTKSVSATRLGLIPWTRLEKDESRARKIRQYIATARKRALSAANISDWNTKEIIESDESE